MLSRVRSFFLPEREYIADTINFRQRSFKLIVEKPTNPDPRKTKPKVFTAIHQNKGYTNINQRNSKQNQATFFMCGKTCVIKR